MKAPRLPGNEPMITLDQYKKIMDLKQSKERIKEMTYVQLAKELGIRPSTVINAARRRIKRYDYQLWKEGKL
jgi:hypothetical protein